VDKKPPTLRTCRSCKRPIHYFKGYNAYVHSNPGDWLRCPVPSGKAKAA
jgi:hypothetical protein